MAERKTLADKARLKARDEARRERERKASTKNRIMTIGLGAAACVLAICVGMTGFRFYQYRVGEEKYDRALSLANIPSLEDLVAYQMGYGQDGIAGAPGSDLIDTGGEEPEDDAWEGLSTEPDEYADRLALMDLSALQAENPDVAGWIDIPGTDVSYPYVQCGDTTTYLRRSWDKTSAVTGSIFMEPGCAQDLKGFNTILYGHNMSNGSMFGCLSEYKSHDWWEDHQTVYLTTPDGVFRYRVFSVRMAGMTDGAFAYGNPTDAEREAMLSYSLSSSEIFTGVDLNVRSRILTLSTCTSLGRYDVRFVVQGVLEWHRSY